MYFCQFEQQYSLLLRISAKASFEKISLPLPIKYIAPSLGMLGTLHKASQTFGVMPSFLKANLEEGDNVLKTWQRLQNQL